jgi:hypothetical protein
MLRSASSQIQTVILLSEYLLKIFTRFEFQANSAVKYQESVLIYPLLLFVNKRSVKTLD